jgi:hypothetical protein
MSSSDDSADDSSASSASSTLSPQVAKKAVWRKRAPSATPIVKPSDGTKAQLIAKIEQKFGDIAGLAKDKRALKRICDQSPELFGGKGTPERRGIQFQVQDWKRYRDNFLVDKQALREEIEKTKELEANMSRQLHLSRKPKVAKKAYSDSDSEDSVPKTRKCNKRVCFVLLDRLIDALSNAGYP